MIECYVYKNTIEGVGSDDNGTMLYMMRHKMDVKEGLHDGGIYHSQRKAVIVNLVLKLLAMQMWKVSRSCSRCHCIFDACIETSRSTCYETRLVFHIKQQQLDYIPKTPGSCPPASFSIARISIRDPNTTRGLGASSSKA